jgi:hypothetical protein
MGRRKGELTPNAVDREYPHQISLPADDCRGTNYYTVNLFADALSVAPRGHSYYHDDEWHQVFCFREKSGAEVFQQRFGGEWFDPARRGRGNKWAQLRNPKKRTN